MPRSRASSRRRTTVSPSRPPGADAWAAGFAAGLIARFAAGLEDRFATGLAAGGLVAGFTARGFAAACAAGFFADPGLVDGTFTDVTPTDEPDFADFGFFVPGLDDLAFATTDSSLASTSAARFFAALSTFFARRFASATASRAWSSAFAAAFSAFLRLMVFPPIEHHADDRC